MKTISLFLILTSLSFSQNTYKGSIIDKDTNEPLIGVNIYIEASYEGTATDFDGNFQFTTTANNPKVKISYIGYKTLELRLYSGIQIKLESSAMTSEVVLVVSDGLTRGERIVLNTMENYEKNFDAIENFKLNVYSKSFFYHPKSEKELAKDDSLRQLGKAEDIEKPIPWLFESMKDVSWEKPNKIHQIVKKRMQGKAIPASFNLTGAVEYQNIFSKRFMNSMSPMYKSHFNDFEYNYAGKELYKNDSCAVVYATKKNKDYWTYRILFDEDNSYLKQIEAIFQAPTKTVVYVTPFLRTFANNLTYIQDYDQFDNVTFPTNFVMNRITKDGVIRLYESYHNRTINVPDFDVKYSDQVLVIDKDVDKTNEKYWELNRPVALAPLEKISYSASDSLYQSYNPLKKFMFNDGIDLMMFNFYIYGQKLTEFRDIYRFNPVEGHFIGLGFENKNFEKIDLLYRLGYSSGLDRFFGDIKTTFVLNHSYDINMSVELYNRVNSLGYVDYFSTFNALFRESNIYHYYEERGMDLSLEKQITNDFKVELRYNNRQLKGLQNSENYAFSKDAIFKENYRISDSQENELKLALSFKEYIKMDLGTMKIEQLKKGGWDLEIDFVLNANDISNLSFKNTSIDINKEFHYSNKYKLELNSYIFYSKENRNIQNASFPKLPNFFENDQEKGLSGMNEYDYLSFDYKSLSASFKISSFLKPFDLAKAGDLSIFITAFNSSKLNKLKDNGFKELDTELDFNIGVNNTNALFGYPLKFAYHYNTLFNSNSFAVSWALNL